ncbi:glycosyl hydrolase [Enterococcus sp. AZ196]|uniref:glycosyl hydrolase n=1 Tax=Enterococcus sp. AZ196 TaxID=2774659 RepID=UPI003D289199
MRAIEERFKEPETESRPRLRYWWPGGYVSKYLDELDKEIKAIADAGFGGVEISDVYDAIATKDAQVLEPQKYGFTSENWRKSVKQAMKSAKKYGVKIDLTVGPHWPAATNEADPDEAGTAKELVYGSYSFKENLLAGTAIEELCPPHYVTRNQKIDGSKIKNKLIAVYTASHISHKEVEMPPAVPWEESYTVISDDIQFDSLKEITSKVKEGKFVETIFPSYKENILIAVYERGTGQRVNMFSMGSTDRPDVMAPYAYVVDHFSSKGGELIQSLWEKNFFFDNEFVELLNEVGDCFFEDSLELQSTGHWTTNMLAQFKERAGYDIRPFLPFVLGINQDKGLGIERSSFQVEQEMNDKIKDLRHDYFKVLNELYQENHLKHLKEWANSLGMKYRAQPYGWAIDSASAAAKLDIVEGESLGFGEDGNDAFRLLAAGRDFGEAKVLSDEVGAYLFQGYATTLSQLFETLHKNYMAGVNQTYWHGMPFKYAPGAKWPGFSAFSPMLGGRGFAESWGERQPVWEHLFSYTTYSGRLHEILKYGKNELDVLIYQEGHNASENKQTSLGDQLTKLGYRYQVMTEGLFLEPSRIEDHKLQVKGADYRSLLIPKGTYLTEKVKTAICKWRDSGLPVIYQESEGLNELVMVLQKSETSNSTGNLLTYQRSDKQHKFLVCYNQGVESISLSPLFQTYKVREWFPWTGEIGLVKGNQLSAKECRIFELLEVGETVIEEKEPSQRVSLKKHPWSLTIESWEMGPSDDFKIEKRIKQKQLLELDYWNKLPEFEANSGIGTYRATVQLENQKPRKLCIRNTRGSLLVKINGKEVLGNALLGEYLLSDEMLDTVIELEIIIGSTLNNYLNTSSLATYYGQFPQQDYGIEDVELLF